MWIEKTTGQVYKNRPKVIRDGNSKFVFNPTDEELANAGYEYRLDPYEERVVARIREKYSINDELAILRQRYDKAEEYQEYYDFVENIKTEEKEKAVAN